jgi:hypothetical protein
MFIDFDIPCGRKETSHGSKPVNKGLMNKKSPCIFPVLFPFVDNAYSEIIHALGIILLFMNFNKTPAVAEALKREGITVSGSECINIPNAMAVLKSLFL